MNYREFIILMSYTMVGRFFWNLRGIFDKEYRGSSWYANNEGLPDIVEMISTHDRQPEFYATHIPRPEDWHQRCLEAFRRKTGREYHKDDDLRSRFYWASVSLGEQEIDKEQNPALNDYGPYSIRHNVDLHIV